VSWSKQPNSHHCFLCGTRNPIGLNVAFWQNEERVLTRVVLRDEHQSYPGVAHGGIVTALLDETMGRAIIGLRDAFAFTAKLEMKFHRPTPLHTPLIVTGWIARERRGWFQTEGTIVVEESGETVASATGTFVFMPDEQTDAMRGQLPFFEVVEDAPTHLPPHPISSSNH
jgi:acyl-coenzyme A thioesterase PaaI-like protein